jgi:hypothetical protein
MIAAFPVGGTILAEAKEGHKWIKELSTQHLSRLGSARR